MSEVFGCEGVMVNQIPEISNEENILGEGTSGVTHKLTMDTKCKDVLEKVDDCDCMNINYPNIARKRVEDEKKVIQNEIDMLTLVRNIPNVNTYIGSTIDRTGADIYMEACSGGDLFNIIADKTETYDRVYPEDIIKRIMSTLFTAVAGLHKNLIVHRDIKAENIVLKKARTDLNWPEHLQIIDFGFARKLTTLEENIPQYIYNNAGKVIEKNAVGTPTYIAPEVCLPEYLNYTSKCDVWSLTILMLLLLTGVPFYDLSYGRRRFGLYDVYKTFTTYAIMAKAEAIRETRKYLRDRAGITTLAISDNAILFILSIMGKEESDRPTAEHALDHAWFHEDTVVEGAAATTVEGTAGASTEGGAFSQKYKKYKAKYKALHTRR